MPSATVRGSVASGLGQVENGAGGGVGGLVRGVDALTEASVRHKQQMWGDSSGGGGANARGGQQPRGCPAVPGGEVGFCMIM